MLTLALGIGANSVVFSVARTVFHRPLGLDGGDRLMWIQRVNMPTGATENQLSWQDLEDIRLSARSFEAVVTDNSSGGIWLDGDESKDVPVLRATPNLGEVLRVRPALGRLLQSSDAEPNAEPVVVICHELCLSRFSGKPGVRMGRLCACQLPKFG